MITSFFHLYGLILGIAIWVTLILIEQKIKDYHFPVRVFWQIVAWVFIGGIIGARLYHVVTDFPLYQNELWRALYIWQGGLSVFGAFIGGSAGLFWYIKTHHNQKIRWQFLADLAIFGIPFGQAIGRLGNFVNQELYGMPTNLPWKIYIDSDHRLADYQQYEFFHPLFFYELLCMFSFGIYVWWREREKNWQVGSGQLFAIYLIYYSVIRFGLDFLRIDKTYFGSTVFSVNQVFLLIIFVLSCRWWYTIQKKHGKEKTA